MNLFPLPTVYLFCIVHFLDFPNNFYHFLLHKILSHSINQYLTVALLWPSPILSCTNNEFIDEHGLLDFMKYIQWEIQSQCSHCWIQKFIKNQADSPERLGWLCVSGPGIGHRHCGQEALTWKELLLNEQVPLKLPCHLLTHNQYHSIRKVFFHGTQKKLKSWRWHQQLLCWWTWRLIAVIFPLWLKHLFLLDIWHLWFLIFSKCTRCSWKCPKVIA